MNGLQSLTQWQSAFGNPSGGKLGLLNAIQVSTPTVLLCSIMFADYARLEYWWTGRLSFCPICVRRYWSSSGRVVGRDYHVHRYRHSNCFTIGWHVHWCPFLDWLWSHFRRQVEKKNMVHVVQ